MKKILSKSKYLAGLQCYRYLWLLFNEPQAIPPFDEVTKFIFKQGHEVGELAKKIFPGGIEIEHDDYTHSGIERSIRKTRENLKEYKPLFEPSFIYNSTFCRPDILEPNEAKGWDIIEVKSSTSKKEVNLHDLSFQKYCLEGNGLEINRCYLMYVNRDYVRKGNIDPEGFFIKEDVTKEVQEFQVGIAKRIESMLRIIESDCPEVIIGKDCYSPYECPLKEKCWQSLPKNNVFELYRGKNLAGQLMQRGIQEIKKIEDTSPLNPIQRVQFDCVKSGRSFINIDSISGFLQKIVYPLYLLDFETFATAIPLFDGTKPYQNIPFQFSCHVFEDIDNLKSHYSFINEEEPDPRPTFLKELKKALGYTGTDFPGGTILVYYEYFEKSILKKLAVDYPGHRQWIEDAQDRIVDLYEPFGNFYFYNPDQKGSASLKSVLPTVTGLDYGDLDINDGQTASIRYINTCLQKDGEDVDPREVEKVKKDLDEYCGLDTEGMVFILRRLQKMIKE